MRLPTTIPAACLLALLCLSPGDAHGQQATPAAGSIPAARLMQPEELVQVLRSGGEKPRVYQIGPHVMYAEAHVPGSEYVGATGLPSGLQALRDRVNTLPHDQSIVLYCGCCPWAKCPNVRPAYEQLVALGFRNVKVL